MVGGEDHVEIDPAGSDEEHLGVMGVVGLNKYISHFINKRFSQQF